MVERRREVRVFKVGSGEHAGKKVIVRVRKQGDDKDVDVDVEGLALGELEPELVEEDDGDAWVMRIRVPKLKRNGDDDALVRAAGVSGAIEDLQGEIGALVRRARSQGYSWTQIGDALGMSKQAAWERFSGED